LISLEAYYNALLVHGAGSGVNKNLFIWANYGGAGGHERGTETRNAGAPR